MHFTCKCLNFMIKATGGFETVDSAIVGQLSNRAHKQDLQIIHYESIVKKIDMLVGLFKKHEWTEFRCRNCNMWVYASRSRDRESPEPVIVINKLTMTSAEQIEDLTRDPKYSSIFNILLYYEIGDNLFSGPEGKLHPAANAWLERQTEIVEARIKKFADFQYNDLEKKKSRARYQQAAIQRAVAVDQQREAAAEEIAKQRLASSPKPSCSSSRKVPQKPGQSSTEENVLELDESILFDSKSSHGSVGASEGSDDDIIELPQPRRAPEQPSMARSLPIPVPQFMDEHRHHGRDDDSPQTPTDIAANIQALARSVHGNPIFGDLPRPPLTKN